MAAGAVEARARSGRLATRASSRLLTNRSFTSATWRALFTSVDVKRPAREESNPERTQVRVVDLVHDHRIGVRRGTGDIDNRPEVSEWVQPRVQADGRDARHGARLLDQLLIEPDAPGGIRIARGRQRDAHGEDLLRWDTRDHVLDRHEGADEEAGSDQQHQRQRHFGDHETLAEKRLTGAAGQAPSRLSHRLRDVASAAVQRRRQAAEHAGQRGQREREDQHRPVQRDFRFVRDGTRRHQRENRRQAGIGEQHADDAGGERQDQALGEQLPNQSASAGAQRGADRHLALTRRRLRQQQVRHVGAGDQRAAARPRRTAPRCHRVMPLRKRLCERQQTDAPFFGKLLRLAFLQVRDDRVAGRPPPARRHTGLQPSEQVHAADAFDRLAALERDRADRRRRRAT